MRCPATTRPLTVPAALLSLPVLLGAQEPARDSVQQLPALEITTSVLPLAGASVGTGTTARATTLDREALARTRARTLVESLAALPGTTAYDDLGSAYKPTLVVRGFTASGVVGLPQGVTVFVDGVPVNEPDAGQVNFDLLPLRHARQVEVFSGTASPLGPNSLAGAVNLVTERGGGPTRGAIAVGAGDRGRRSAEFSAAGARGGTSYYAGAGADRERGWRQLTTARLEDVFVSVGRWEAARGVGLQLLGARSIAETAGSLPQSVYAVRPDSNLSAGDFEDLRQLHAAVAGYAPMAGGTTAVRAFVRAHDAERFNVNQIDDPDIRGFSENRSLGARTDWMRVVAHRGVAATLRAGLGGSVHATRIRLLTERIDPGLTTDVESPIRKVDAHLLATAVRGPITLSGGARYDVVQIPFRNLLRPARDTTSLYRQLNPRIGASVALPASLTLFGSLSRSFRAPAVIELACADPQEPCPLPFALGDDPPLAPVVATTREAGLRWERGWWAMDAAAYHTTVRDDIFLFPYEDESEPSGSTIDGFFANIPRTRRAGVEARAHARTPAGHAVHAAYGYTRATFGSGAEIFSIREAAGEENEVEPGDRLPLVPDHTLSAGATLRLGPAALGADVRHVGRRWLRGDEANETAPLPGYTVLAVRASLERGPWSADAAVSNLLDRRYATFGGYNINQGSGGGLERFLTPAAPRALMVTLRRSFGG